MTQPVITMIHTHNVYLVWPQVEALLDPALVLSNTHSSEDVRKSIMCGNAHLWAQWSDKIESAVVTEFINYPKGLWLRLWLSGAIDGAHNMWNEFFDILYAFAIANKCKGIEDCGRAGWTRYKPEARKIATLRRLEIGV